MMVPVWLLSVPRGADPGIGLLSPSTECWSTRTFEGTGCRRRVIGSPSSRPTCTIFTTRANARRRIRTTATCCRSRSPLSHLHADRSRAIGCAMGSLTRMRIACARFPPCWNATICDTPRLLPAVQFFHNIEEMSASPGSRVDASHSRVGAVRGTGVATSETSGTQSPSSKLDPVDPVTGIIEAFRSHSAVALSDPHGGQQIHEFLLPSCAIRRSPVVNDIVVEPGRCSVSGDDGPVHTRGSGRTRRA